MSAPYIVFDAAQEGAHTVRPYCTLLFVLTGSLLLVGLFSLPQYDIMGFALPGMLISMLYSRHTRKCETQCKD